jgi:hypothetical protein
MERNVHFGVLLVCPHRTESEHAVVPVIVLLASKGYQILELFSVEQTLMIRATKYLSFPLRDPIITPEGFKPFPGVIKGAGTA